MVSFIQQVEGPREVRSNEQIVERDLSYVNSFGRVAENVGKAIDQAGTEHGKITGAEAVRQAEAQVEREVAESAELAALEELGNKASADEVERRISLLDKGVTSGKISRENARLRVAELVTTEIQSNPFFQDRIRQSASRMLGFDPVSEGTQQFFQAFDTRAEQEAAAARAASTKDTAWAKHNRDLAVALDLPVEYVADMRAKSELAELEQEDLKRQLERGTINNNNFIAKSGIIDSTQAVTNIFATAKATFREKGSLSGTEFSQIIADTKEAYIASTLQALPAGEAVTPDQEQRVRDAADRRYKQLEESIGKFSEEMLQENEIKRLTNMYTLYGMKAFPKMTAISLGTNDRIAAQVFDMLSTARNNSQLQALKKSSALRDFVEIAEMTDEEFAKTVGDSLEKMFAPDVPKGDLTREEEAHADAGISQLLKNAPPEDRSRIVQVLLDKGFNNKAESILMGDNGIKIPRSTATPEEVKYLNRTWELTKNVLPEQIANDIIDGNLSDAKTNQGVDIAVTPDGLLTLNKAKSDGTPDPQRFLHPSWQTIQKINKFLKSSDTAWGMELGIPNRMTAAKAIQSKIERATESNEEALERIRKEVDADVERTRSEDSE